MKINRDRELNLSLYRHWTLFKSLQHTPYTAMKFRTFSLKGEDKLHEFLADLGIPLNQQAAQKGDGHRGEKRAPVGPT